MVATFNISVSGGSSPYVVSVKRQGDTEEKWISGGTSGSGTVSFSANNGTHQYNWVVSKSGCISASGTFTLTCGSTPTPTPTPTCNLSVTVSNIVCES